MGESAAVRERRDSLQNAVGDNAAAVRGDDVACDMCIGSGSDSG